MAVDWWLVLWSCGRGGMVSIMVTGGQCSGVVVEVVWCLYGDWWLVPVGDWWLVLRSRGRDGVVSVMVTCNWCL